MRRYLLISLLSLLSLLSFSAWALTPPTQENYLYVEDDRYFIDNSLNNRSYSEGFTFSVWIKFNARMSSYNWIVGHTESSFSIHASSANNNEVILFLKNQNVVLNDFPIQQWVNLAVSFDGTNAIFYQDGVEVGQRSYSDTELLIANDDSFRIGYFFGNLKQLKIWNRALTTDELLTQISQQDSSASNPIHQWLFDEGLLGTYHDTGSAGVHFYNIYGRLHWENIHSPYEILFQSEIKLYESDGKKPETQAWGRLDFNQDGLNEIFIAGSDNIGFAQGENMLIFSIDENYQIIDVSDSMITGGLYFTPYPTGRDPVIDDFNGDGFDDLFMTDSSGHGGSFIPTAPHLLISDIQNSKLTPSENQISSLPCNLPAPAFAGQKPCKVTESANTYPDPNAELVPIEPLSYGHAGTSGDVDRDGDLDLFTLNQWWGLEGQLPVESYFLINDGQGNFVADWQLAPDKLLQQLTTFSSGPAQDMENDIGYSFAPLVDLDGDGFLDMVMIKGIVEAARLIGLPQDPFAAETESSHASIYELIAWGDENGFSENYTLIGWQDLPPAWDELYSNTAPNFADVDNDGDLDILLAREPGSDDSGVYIQLYINNGDRTFTDRTTELIPQDYSELSSRSTFNIFETFDLNGDGCIDFYGASSPQAGATNLANPYRMMINNCAGYFTPVRDSFFGTDTGLMIPVDLDGDGGLDFMTVNLWEADAEGPRYEVSLIKQISPIEIDYFIDTDRDGVLDSLDNDDDGDGVNDSDDAFPKIAQDKQPFNAGHAGAWYNPDTSGQGQLIDIEPESGFMFLAWFAYTEASSDNPNEQHWFTAQGTYDGNTAVLPVYETLGGQFDDPTEVDPPTLVGSIELMFEDCTSGQANYSIDSWGVTGSFPLSRVIPGSENVCLVSSGASAEAINQNDVWDGAWYNTETSGQGFLIDSLSNSDGDDFIFVAWFTYGDSNASGQRWLTAQGPLKGDQAEIAIYKVTGGSFDDPTPVNPPEAIGSMSIEFTGCNTAQLRYDLTDEGLSGSMEIVRVIPGTEALCESLVESN